MVVYRVTGNVVREISLQSLIRILLPILFLLPYSLHADVVAQLDKSTLYLGEKLSLTLESDQSPQVRPDLRALQTDFTVLGTRQVTVSSHTAGKVSARTRWILLLSPLQEGEQVIPPISIGEQTSLPLSLSVLPANQNPSIAETGRAIYLEVSLDQEEVYLQSQAILRAKIFHLAPLPLNANLSSPESTAALIKPLEEQRQYTELVRGQNYTVTESSYAVFPNETGEIEISPIFFSTILPNEKLIEFNSEALFLSVLPNAFQSSNNLWLPAKTVYIEDNLADKQEVTAGSEIRRIISLEVEGLPAAALPSLSPLTYKSSNTQLLNVVLEERKTHQGIISQRIEELIITPHSSGELRLPPIDIPWWNTLTDKGQTATLSHRNLVVNTQANNTVLAAQPVSEKVHLPTGATSSASSPILIWILMLISLITSLGWLYTFNRLLKLKGNNQQQEAKLKEEQALRQKVASEITEKNTFQALTMACIQNDPEIAQLRLIEWAQSFWKNSELHTVEQLCEYAGNQTLNFLVLDLEQHLYSSSPERWQGDLLLRNIEKIRDRQNRLALDIEPGENKLKYAAI